MDNNVSANCLFAVGSGAGGSTVAGRLAQTAASVLLLEEGPSASPESMLPWVFPLIGQSEVIDAIRTEPQKNAQLDSPNNVSTKKINL